MNYFEIMCKFCNKCTGEKIMEDTIKVDSKVNSDVIVVRCENYISAEFKGITE